MSPSELVLLLATWLGLAVIFPIVISSLAPLSGWEQLADHYRLQGDFPQGGHRFQSMMLNNTSYRRILRMVETPQGVYLVPMGLFRLDHPPLFIPWHTIQIEEQSTWWGWYRGHIQTTPPVEFHVPLTVKRRWAPYLQSASSSPLTPQIS